jgi:RNA polymerase sigma-70 factor (ECF subfamily)
VSSRLCTEVATNSPRQCRSFWNCCWIIAHECWVSARNAPALGAEACTLPRARQLHRNDGMRTQGPRSREAEQQFRKIYNGHVRLVRVVLRNLGVRAADIDDATQKAFLIAYLRLPSFEGRSLLSTWICGISRRVASEHRRLASTRLEVILPFEAFDALTPRYHVMDDVDRADAHLIGRTVLNRMPKAQRETFSLVEVEGMAAPEVAELMSVPLSTVWSRLRLARRRCRRILAQWAPTTP